MRRASAFALALALRSPPAAGAEPAVPAEEAEFCKLELEALRRRAQVFQGQGLSAAEIRRQNGPYEQHLAECRQRYRAELRHREEELRTLREISERTPSEANQRERARIEREVRVRRAQQRRPEDLSPDERRLLDEVRAEEAVRRQADARARDPVLRRQLLSAEHCAHTARRDRARAEIAEEERLADLGGADRQRIYFLRAELRRDEDVLARNRPELQRAGGALPCGDARVAPVARCLELEAAGGKDEACESEAMRDLLRILRDQ